MTDASFHDRIHEFQINQIMRDARFSMGESHYHPYYELYYLTSGQCKGFISHNIHYLFPGDMILIPPAVLHKFLYETNRPVQRITVSFTPEFVYAFRQSCGETAWDHIFSRFKLTIPSSLQPDIRLIMAQLQDESQKTDVYSRIQLQSGLFQLLSTLGRCQNLKQAPQRLDQSESAVQEAARYIYEHYPENITLDGAAGIAHMSPSYFSKKFKESTGFGFKEYLTHIRLQEAAHLLTSTQTPITEIAGICGFSDGNYFGDAFRKNLGMSPRNYRKQGAQSLQ